MVDDSNNTCSPIFYVVDKTSRIRVAIYGTWNGNNDNDLRIRVLDENEIEFYGLNKK